MPTIGDCRPAGAEPSDVAPPTAATCPAASTVHEPVVAGAMPTGPAAYAWARDIARTVSSPTAARRTTILRTGGVSVRGSGDLTDWRLSPPHRASVHPRRTRQDGRLVRLPRRPRGGHRGDRADDAPGAVAVVPHPDGRGAGREAGPHQAAAGA